MATYREIVTKAVIAKGKKVYTTTHILSPENIATKVLGCWIINHQFKPVFNEGKVVIEGSYEVHIWYAYKEDSTTAIMQRSISYVEEVPLKIKSGEEISKNTEFKAECNKYPVCTSLKLLEGGHIEVIVDKEFSLDGVGETRLRVLLSQTFEDEYALEEEIDKGVNSNFFQKKTA